MKIKPGDLIRYTERVLSFTGKVMVVERITKRAGEAHWVEARLAEPHFPDKTRQNHVWLLFEREVELLKDETSTENMEWE